MKQCLFSEEFTEFTEGTSTDALMA